MYVHAKSLQSCLTLCNPMDCSPPGSSVHGILQTRIRERVAMPFSRESSQPRGSKPKFLGRWVLYHSCPLGSPESYIVLDKYSDGICFSVSFRLYNKLLFIYYSTFNFSIDLEERTFYRYILLNFYWENKIYYYKFV